MTELQRQMTRFVVVGLANTMTGGGIIIGLTALGVHYVIANVLGFACGLLLSFVLNRGWTFRSKGNVIVSLGRFMTLFGVCFLANLIVLSALIWAGANPYVSQAAGMAIYSIGSFLGAKLFVFRADRSPSSSADAT